MTTATASFIQNCLLDRHSSGLERISLVRNCLVVTEAY